MDTNTLQQYLTKVHQEMLIDMAKKLGSYPINFNFAEIICRPLFTTASLVVTDIGSYKIYVCASKQGNELNENEIAIAELGLAHETGHILHMESNPAWHRNYNQERDLVKTFIPFQSTPRFNRLFDLGEVTAEYLALQFADERQGLDVFLKRQGELGKSGIYARVRRAMRRIPSERRIEVANILVKSEYSDVRKVIELDEEIFSETERYIAKNPKVFTPPYQLVIPALKELIW